MRRTRQRVLVVFGAGPTWKSGPPDEQPGWDAHADFVDALVAAGTFVMGGPFSDYSGSVNLLEGVSAEEAEAFLQNDPFVENGVFVIESVRDWTVWVDELASAGDRPSSPATEPRADRGAARTPDGPGSSRPASRP